MHRKQLFLVHRYRTKKHLLLKTFYSFFKAKKYKQIYSYNSAKKAYLHKKGANIEPQATSQEKSGGHYL